MNRHILNIFTLILLTLTLGLQAKDLPKIKILATGGTIAGAGDSATKTNYTAGKVELTKLISAVPELKSIGDISGEQVAKIGSQDIDDNVWLQLTKRINKLLASEDVDGIVITHGTDTMEETAYFLSLTIKKSDKPVILVGSMRPSTAISTDGPLNLLNAVLVAADKSSKGRGVMVVMNDAIMDARDVTKMHTTGVDAFQSPNFGNLGFIHNQKVQYYRKSERQSNAFDVDNLSTLPKVGIVYGHANASPILVEALVKNKFDGIVYAGVGNGNICGKVLDALKNARLNNVQVARSSRTLAGATTLDTEVDDEKYQFIASGTLNPQKARILLMLAITKTKDRKEIQSYFLTF